MQISGSFATSGSQYETSTWPPVFYDITCTGEESSLWDCAYSTSDAGRACGFDAAATCQGNSTVALVYNSNQIKISQLPRLCIQTALLVRYVLSMEPLSMKEELSCAMVMHGELYVMTTGTLMMPMLYVASLDTTLLV